MPLFVSGYMQAMEAKKPAIHPLVATHFVDLMCDDKLYGWEHINAFYAVWLQQMEHGHVMWVDEDAKVKFQRALIWHQPTATRKASAPTSA